MKTKPGLRRAHLADRLRPEGLIDGRGPVRGQMTRSPHVRAMTSGSTSMDMSQRTPSHWLAMAVEHAEHGLAQARDGDS